MRYSEFLDPENLQPDWIAIRRRQLLHVSELTRVHQARWKVAARAFSTCHDFRIIQRTLHGSLSDSRQVQALRGQHAGVDKAEGPVAPAYGVA